MLFSTLPTNSNATINFTDDWYCHYLLYQRLTLLPTNLSTNENMLSPFRMNAVKINKPQKVITFVLSNKTNIYCLNKSYLEKNIYFSSIQWTIFHNTSLSYNFSVANYKFVVRFIKFKTNRFNMVAFWI